MRGWKPAVALAGMVVAAGCGSSPHATAGSTSSGSTSSTVTTVKSRVSTSLPTSIPNDDAKRSQVEIDSCSASPGGWTARGIAFNRGQSSEHFDITVFFAKSGGTGSWTIRSQFVADPSTRCVVVGVG